MAPRVLWPFTALAVLGLPATSLVYFPALLRTGTLPTDGDSIAIPVFGTVLIGVIFLPVALGAVWLSLRHRPASVHLLAWRSDRPLLSAALSVAAGAPALLLLAGFASVARDPWPEPLWAPWLALFAAWFLLLRAAALSPGRVSRSAGEAGPA